MAITSVDINKEALREIKELKGFKTDREAIDDAILMSLARARQDLFFTWLAEHPFDDDQINPQKIDYPL